MKKNKKNTTLPIVINEILSSKINSSNISIEESLKVKKYQSSTSYIEGFHRPISKIIELSDEF